MDIDTTPPTSHHENRPSMQLDIPPPDQVMMEVDPVDTNLIPTTPTADANSNNTSNSNNNSILASPIHQWFINSNTPCSPIPNNMNFDPSSLTTSLPPSAIITLSDVASWPKLKLDQLFIEWFSRPESQSWISSLIQDFNDGKSFLPTSSRSQSPGRATSSKNRSFSPQQAPSSPVSKLFSSHIPFEEAESSPHSPPATPTFNSQHHHQQHLHTAALMELGKSGTLSPIRVDHQNTICHSPTSSPTSNNITSASQSPQCTSNTKVTTITTAATTVPVTQQSDSSSIVVNPDGAIVISEKAPIVQTPEQNHADNMTQQQQQVNDTTMEQSLKETLKYNSMRKQVSNDMQKIEKVDNINNNCINSSTEETSSPLVPIANGEIEKKERNLSPAKDSTSDSIDEDQNRSKNENANDVPNRPPIIPTTTTTTTTMSDISSHKQPDTSKRKTLPKFYFPCGRDADAREKVEQESMNDFFTAHKSQRKVGGVNRTEIEELVVKVVGLPSYFGSIIFSIIVDQFPRRSNNSNNNNTTSVNNGDENMKDINDGGEEGSSSSQVSGMERSVMTDNNNNNNSNNNSDAKMVDGDSGSNINNNSINNNGSNINDNDNNISNANSNNNCGGEMKDVAGSSSDGKILNEKDDDYITEEQMKEFYNLKCKGKSREVRLFQTLLGRARRNYLVASDFKPLMRALLMCHQGLAFLHATPEFQQRYSETVIERIYFGCTRQHNGRLTLGDIKRCKLLDTLMTIDDEEDINRERKYFSYEHFYVLYCRFWELDANHDLQIDKEDLMRYSSHSLTTRIVDRIFSGHARPLDAPQNTGYMSYTDFIWFCLSEEDKTSDTAIDYWFRCIDMDGDGIITMFDMEYFYKEQLHRMESFGHEPVQIKDILCQLLDMISPNIKPPVIRRRDLKKCRLAGNFFNILFNLNKFFTIEARDPLQIRQEHATPQLTDWDRFAALEYLRLSADEEGDEDESWEEVGDAPNPLLAGEAPF